MSRIPNFNIKSKLKFPSGFKGQLKSTNEKNQEDEGKDKITTPSNKIETRSVTLQEQDVESNEKVDHPESDHTETASKISVEKTSQCLSKLAEKLNTAGGGKDSDEAAGNSSSKVVRHPAFRRRTSSNSTKVSAGQPKDKSAGLTTHGQSPYGKTTSHLATKPPAGKPKSNAAAKAGIIIDSKASRLPGVSASSTVQSRRNGTSVALQENGNVHRRASPIEEDQKVKASLGSVTVVQVSSESGKQSNNTATGIRSVSERFGVRQMIGKSSQNSRPNSADTESMKPRSFGLIKRGSNERLQTAVDQDSKSIPGNEAIEKRGNKIELRKASSKENIKKDSTTQQRQLGLAGPQFKATSQLKAPSKELQTMAVKLRSYGGKRPQRPLSYSAGKPSDPAIYRRRSGIPSTAANTTAGIDKISSSSSMQNLSSRTSPERKVLEDATTSKLLVKSRSASSIATENSAHARSDINVGKLKKIAGLKSTGMKPPSQRPTAVSVLPRSKSSSTKTVSSSSSEFATTSYLHGEPYQSTPLRTVSDNEIPIGNKYAGPFVYDELSGVFDDETHDNVNRTFDQKKPSPQPAKILDVTFDAAALTVKGNDQLANAIQNATFIQEADAGCHAVNNETFDKGVDDVTRLLDSSETGPVLNETRVLDVEDQHVAAVGELKRNVLDRIAQSFASNMSSTPNDAQKNCSAVQNKTIDINRTIDIVDSSANESEDENIAEFRGNDCADDKRKKRQADTYRRSGVHDLVTNNIKACCTDEFLENEAMVLLDDSFLARSADDSSNSTPQSSKDRMENGKESNSNANGVAASNACETGGYIVLTDNVKDANEKSGPAVEDTQEDERLLQGQTSSRCLQFNDVTSPINEQHEADGNQDEVLGVSLIDDSYDLITCDDVKGCFNVTDYKMMNKRGDESAVSTASSDIVSTVTSTASFVTNTTNASSIGEIAAVVTYEIGKTSGGDDIEFDAAKKNKISCDEEDLNGVAELECGGGGSQNAVAKTAVDGVEDNCRSKEDISQTNSIGESKQSGDSDVNITLINNGEKLKEEVDIESIDTNNELKPEFSHSNPAANSHNNNATADNANLSAAAIKEFSSLLSQAIEAGDSFPVVQSSATKEQMKATTRRRSLVRRNTSPYFSMSMPSSFSAGPNFRMPKEAAISETEDGSVIMDESTFRYCQNETKLIKTNLLRLKRILQEVDVMSPFIKHPNKLNCSPPNTPSRPSVNRSFSDASSWLSKVSRSHESTPFASMQRTSTTRSKTLPRSSNKTDQEKMEDEISNIKEKNKCLELEIEDLQHDLESKNYTIKLLQTQLENQEFAEQIELLTEEKIILSEENQMLREKLEQLEQSQKEKTTNEEIVKEQFLEVSGSAKKLRAGMLQRYYDGSAE
eukprot:gene17785-19561_t